MELVTNGTGSGDGGTELGSRVFSPLDHSRPALATFVREMLAEVALDGPRGGALVDASLHAFSLFGRLGLDHEDIRVTTRAAEDHFIVEMTNGLDFQVALRNQHGGLAKTNLDLVNLIAFVDEVEVGRTDEGRSIVRLAVRLHE